MRAKYVIGLLIVASLLLLSSSSRNQLKWASTIADESANNFAGWDASGNASVVTGAQVTAQLSNFSSSAKGVVPSSGGGSTNFLRADGTWAVPPGSAVANASTTVAGIVEQATITEIDNANATGGTGAQLFVGPADLNSFLAFKTDRIFTNTSGTNYVAVLFNATAACVANTEVFVECYVGGVTSDGSAGYGGKVTAAFRNSGGSITQVGSTTQDIHGATTTGVLSVATNQIILTLTGGIGVAHHRMEYEYRVTTY